MNATGQALRAQAITTYNPNDARKSGVIDGNSNLIPLKVGDFVVVTDKSRGDWWLGHIEGK